MDGRVAATAVALLLLALSALGALGAQGQNPPTTVPKFDIGYGPAMLFPSSGGTPVFSTGDQLWVRLNYNASLQVGVSPVGPNATAHYWSLPPGVPVRLLTFNSSTPQGFWDIATTSQPYYGAAFLVSHAADTPSGFSLSGERFVGGSLGMNFSTSSTLALYSGQACVLGNSDPSGAVLKVPPQVGGGSLSVTREGDALTLTGLGLGKSNFSLSLELYYAYSFLAPNSTAIILTRSVEVAAAPGVLVRGGSPLPQLTLREDAPLKAGRYELRAFFESSSGVSLATADLLIPGGPGWVWLGACGNYPVYSNNFGAVVPLGSDPQSWPRTVWLTYTSYGEQGCVELPLNLEIAKVDFVGTPWGVTLSGYRVVLNPGSGVSQAEAYNGTAYLILSAPAGYFGYTAGLGNRDFFNGTVGPILPFTSSSVGLNVSRISVTYLVGGNGFEGGTVALSDRAGIISTEATDGAGKAVFYAVPGTYTIDATGGNTSASLTVSVPAGQSVDVILGGASDGFGLVVVAALLVAAVAGAAANVFVFRRVKHAGQD